MANSMWINRQLNDYVKDNGIKQIHLSQQTGIPADTISRILRGERRIMADEFLEICFILDVNPLIFKKPAATDAA